MNKPELFDIEAPLALHKGYLIPILIVLIIIILLAVFFTKKTNKMKPQEVLSPYEKARKALSSLNINEIDFTFQLTAIVKEFIETCLNCHVVNQTTEEFLKLKAKTLPLETANTLISFLEACDLAKFAKVPYNATEQKQLIQQAEKILTQIHKTI